MKRAIVLCLAAGLGLSQPLAAQSPPARADGTLGAGEFSRISIGTLAADGEGQ